MLRSVRSGEQLVVFLVLAYGFAAFSGGCRDRLSPAGELPTQAKQDIQSNRKVALSMPSNPPRFKNIAELTRHARIQAAGVAADEDRQSLPIPVLRAKGLRVIFFFCPALAKPGQPVGLRPPHYQAVLQPETGKLEELRAVTPRDFGQQHDETEVIGTFALPEGMSAEAFISKRDQLYGLYDILLPEFVAGRSVSDQRIRSVAKEFRQIFSVLSEPPLRPYYDSVGDKFFIWVEQLVQ